MEVFADYSSPTPKMRPFSSQNLPDLDGDYDDIVKDIKKRLKEKNQEKLPYRPGSALIKQAIDLMIE